MMNALSVYKVSNSLFRRVYEKPTIRLLISHQEGHNIKILTGGGGEIDAKEGY